MNKGSVPILARLRSLQADVRDDRAPALAECTADASVQVHACHGPARQVEVLRECLLHLFEDDPTLAGAAGNVRAVTGTYPVVGESGIVIKGQAFGGYIDARSGRRLAYHLVVNDVPITSINDLLAIFQDEGTISAILWRDF